MSIDNVPIDRVASALNGKETEVKVIWFTNRIKIRSAGFAAFIMLIKRNKMISNVNKYVNKKKKKVTTLTWSLKCDIWEHN